MRKIFSLLSILALVSLFSSLSLGANFSCPADGVSLFTSETLILCVQDQMEQPAVAVGLMVLVKESDNSVRRLTTEFPIAKGRVIIPAEMVLTMISLFSDFDAALMKLEAKKSGMDHELELSIDDASWKISYADIKKKIDALNTDLVKNTMLKVIQNAIDRAERGTKCEL